MTCGLLKTLRGSRRSARHYNSSGGSDRPCSFNRWKRRGRGRRGEKRRGRERGGRSGWHGDFSQGKGSKEREGRGGKEQAKNKAKTKAKSADPT
jgi:hypothetical protein